MHAHKYGYHLDDVPCASSHIMHRIRPDQPLSSSKFFHFMGPRRAGRIEVRVERVNERGIAKRVWPSYQPPSLSREIWIRGVA